MTNERCPKWDSTTEGPGGQCELAAGHGGKHQRYLSGARSLTHWENSLVEKYAALTAESASLRAQLEAAREQVRTLKTFATACVVHTVKDGGHTLGCRCDDTNCKMRAAALSASEGEG